MKNPFCYPGDRGQVCVEREEAELALVLINEGKRATEVVKYFVECGYKVWEACNIFQAARYLQKHD